MTQSTLFSVYNKARTAARQGKLDLHRTNRALGILMSKDADERLNYYQATTTSCTCIDHVTKHNICKHMICRQIQYRINHPK